MYFNVLSLLVIWPLLGAMLIALVRDSLPQRLASRCTRLSLVVSVSQFLAVLFIIMYGEYLYLPDVYGFQLIEKYAWLGHGVFFALGLDGLSLPFLLLTTALFPLCFAFDAKQTVRVKERLILFLILESVIIAVFLAIDLVTFFIFFELSLIPLFLIIGIWGSEGRVFASMKFFIYTMTGAVALLASILYIYSQTGTTYLPYLIGFDFQNPSWLWLGFFIAFVVKLPLWPVHTWLPHAHVQAPTSGSVILAAVLLKLGGYGMVRFLPFLFDNVWEYLYLFGAVLGVISIIYGAMMAIVQTDAKKMIAYSSISHMGFVPLGVMSANMQAIQGSIMQMVSHGLISAALFFCIGILYKQTHTRLISNYGGLASVCPFYSTMFMFFCMASAALPGTSGFVGEFLVFLGTIAAQHYVLASIAMVGVVLSAAYMLLLIRKMLFGQPYTGKISDCDATEKGICICLAVGVLALGFMPGLLFDMTYPALDYVGYA